MGTGTKEEVMTRTRRWVFALAAAMVISAIPMPNTASAATLDELSLDRWKLLREAERYQLQIAEKYYREKNWKVALAEYEKFVTLYESSEGAAYAQLKWSICQVLLRKQNTAIKDGFQSVIDYWPDSEDAIAASYYIGRTFKDMGEPKKAKKAYMDLLAKHSKHLAGVLARVDLVDMYRLEGDETRQVQLWKELTFDTDRLGEAKRPCEDASRQYAVHCFSTGKFDEGQKALATTYTPPQLPYYILYYAQAPISQLTASDETKAMGERVADAAITFVREQIPSDLTDPEVKKTARTYWFYIADFQSVARRADKVPEVYEQIAKIFGNDDELLGRLAAWYKSQNRRDDARAAYRRYENKFEGQNQVAYSYREEQKYEQAVPIYRTLALQDMENPSRWLAETAMTYRHWGKCDEAVGVYRELLNSDIDRGSEWQWQIACTFRDFNRHKEAIANFRQTDNFPEAYKQMAWCHRRLKEYKEALGLYYQIIGSDPPSAPWALIQVAYTQEQAGDKEKAIKAFQQVCDKFTDSGYASEAHAYLQDKFKISYTKGGGTKN